MTTLRERDLRLGTSRCGDFGMALDLLVDPALAHRLGERMVTDVVPAARLSEGFAQATRGGKVIVAHPGGFL